MKNRKRNSNKANTPCITYLERAGVSYTMHSYTHDEGNSSYGLEAAERLDVEADRIFKSLVVEVDESQLLVCIIPVTHRLSMKAVAKAHGAKKAQMADKSLVQRTTGYVLGGVSPIGQKITLPTYIDESAILYESILVSGGMRGIDIELKVDDLQLITQARYISLVV
mgnify:CR=1 FL=1